MHYVSCNDLGFLCSFSGEYQIPQPHTLVQCEQVFGPFIAEVNKEERGLKPTEAYVSKYSEVRTECLMCVDVLFLKMRIWRRQ